MSASYLPKPDISLPGWHVRTCQTQTSRPSCSSAGIAIKPGVRSSEHYWRANRTAGWPRCAAPMRPATQFQCGERSIPFRRPATSLRWLATIVPNPDRRRKWFNASCQANDGIYLFAGFLALPSASILLILAGGWSRNFLEGCFEGFWAFFRRHPNYGNTVPNEENVSWLRLVEICRGNGSRTAKAPGWTGQKTFGFDGDGAIPRLSARTNAPSD